TPCVLWIDEIEKGLAAGSADGDGGVSRRVLGYLLTWMAERRSSVFLVATANQVQELPAELLRKGRFDEIFFVDLPDADTRAHVFELHLRRRELPADRFDLPTLAQASQGFSGAEIEQAIVAALYTAHADGRAVDNVLLLEEIGATRPLSVVMREQVEALRAWAPRRTVSPERGASAGPARPRPRRAAAALAGDAVPPADRHRAHRHALAAAVPGHPLFPGKLAQRGREERPLPHRGQRRRHVRRVGLRIAGIDPGHVAGLRHLAFDVDDDDLHAHLGASVRAAGIVRQHGQRLVDRHRPEE